MTRKPTAWSVGVLVAALCGWAQDAMEPSKFLWRSVRTELQSERGPKYFEESVKDCLIPGGAHDLKRFRGRLIAMRPEKNPTELTLSG